MRRWKAIAKATALEILSEPLSLLVLLAALALSTLAPAFHYHQFGEASRMARDSGLSALFTCGTVMAVIGTIRSFRREIESGTAEMALSHPVSRRCFVLSKTIGAFFALMVFWAIVSLQTCIIVNGAEIGGMIASSKGDVARLWGPSFSIGMAVMTLPLVAGALLNRFFGFRFVPTAFALALMTALCGAAYRMDVAMMQRLLPVQFLILTLSAVYLFASAAFAVRFRSNVAVSSVFAVVAASIPFIGNYYLSDALSDGGAVPWTYAAVAAAALLPAVAAFAVLASVLFNERDIA
jgi:ABC-type transport system involved in multi-copper enzyme maturation permease subunit